MDRLPFLFRVEDLYSEKLRYYLVKIAAWDLAYYDAEWMCDPEMEESSAFVPDVDIVYESHKFDTEKEALEFIKDWWKKV